MSFVTRVLTVPKSHIHHFKSVVLVILNMLLLFFYHLFSCFYKRMFQINRNGLKIIILHEDKQKNSATKTADIINTTWGQVQSL
jgi:hypothetical protein